MKKLINPFILKEETWTLKRYKKIAYFIKGNRVLDIGCGYGRLGKVTDIELHGIDIVQERVDICKKLGYKSVLCLDIDENTLPFPDEYFSSIACLDILEHLYSPLELLKEVNRVLEDRGRIIISSPNIGFWLFRVLHLFGIFSDVQIPQRIVNNHIRFFTIRRLKNILSLSGFKTKIAYGDVNVPWFIAKPLNLLAKIYPSLFAYSLILVAEKVKPPQTEDLLLSKSILEHLLKVIKYG